MQRLKHNKMEKVLFNARCQSCNKKVELKAKNCAVYDYYQIRCDCGRFLQ